jgi:tetratricopeptide (TPR) repeat protein
MKDTTTRNPQAWGAHNDYGVILAEGGDYPAATREFEQSVKYNPNNAEAYMNLGYALVLQRNYAGAESNYLAAIKINPRSGPAHKMYARFLEMQGKNAQAIFQLQVAAIFNPEVDTYVDLSSLDYAAGNWHRAAADLREILALKPDKSSRAATLNNLAGILATCPDASVRDGKEAVRDAEEACQLTDFKQPVLISTLAAAYAEAGRFPDAVTTAETALNLAKELGDGQTASTSQQLLRLYQAGKPYHQNPLHR